MLGNNIDVDNKCFFASLSSRTLCERSLVALLCRDDIDIKDVGQLQYSLFIFLWYYMLRVASKRSFMPNDARCLTLSGERFSASAMRRPYSASAR